MAGDGKGGISDEPAGRRGGKGASKAERAARLAAELRANLKKRKGVQRAQRAAPETGDDRTADTDGGSDTA